MVFSLAGLCFLTCWGMLGLGRRSRFGFGSSAVDYEGEGEGESERSFMGRLWGLGLGLGFGRKQGSRLRGAENGHENAARERLLSATV